MKTFTERLREQQEKERDAAQLPKPVECVCEINPEGVHKEGCPRARKETP